MPKESRSSFDIASTHASLYVDLNHILVVALEGLMKGLEKPHLGQAPARGIRVAAGVGYASRKQIDARWRNNTSVKPN